MAVMLSKLKIKCSGIGSQFHFTYSLNIDKEL